MQYSPFALSNLITEYDWKKIQLCTKAPYEPIHFWTASERHLVDVHEWSNRMCLCSQDIFPLMKCFFSVCRVQASCLSICSWSATQRRRCTSRTQTSTGRASVTARITRGSSCSRRRGPAAAAPRTSPVKPRCRWTPVIPPCSNAPSMTRCPRPAEDRTEWSSERTDRQRPFRGGMYCGGWGRETALVRIGGSILLSKKE